MGELLVGAHERHDVRNVSQAPKFWTTPDRVYEPLYAFVVVNNFHRFKSRWKHALRAFQHFIDSGVVLYVLEIAFGEREHSLEDFAAHKVFAKAPALGEELAANCRHDDPYRGMHRYVKLRTNDVLWYKENGIMILSRFVPADAKYFCMLDADILFTRPNWVAETIQQLQHYKVLQMFSSAQDLGPNYEVLHTRPSFMSQFKKGLPIPAGYGYGKRPWAGAWSGLAWAWRRDAWDAVGGIPDFCVHGGGDWHLAWALIEKVKFSVRKDLHPAYIKKLLNYQELCTRYIRRDIGVMTGTVQHMFHGPKSQRKYADRHKLLADTKFNPDKDLRTDSQGLYHLVDDGSERFIQLRDGLRQYALERNEDSLEI